MEIISRKESVVIRYSSIQEQVSHKITMKNDGWVFVRDLVGSELKPCSEYIKYLSDSELITISDYLVKFDNLKQLVIRRNDNNVFVGTVGSFNASNSIEVKRLSRELVPNTEYTTSVLTLTVN